jgi:hypothetical protein
MIFQRIASLAWALSALSLAAAPQTGATVQQAVAPASNIQLGRLTPTSATQEWGQLQIDKSVSGAPMMIAGQHFDHGLGTHASGQFVYDLLGDYATFKASVGVDDALKADPEASKASVVFQVFADGVKVFDSGVMKMGDKAKPIEVSVSDVSELKLVSSDAGDGKTCDHADWANAVLVRAIGKPNIANPYPDEKALTASPGATRYFVDPVKGNDDHDGKSSRQAWKTFAKINALRLAPGDTVLVAPGIHSISLKPSARGTAEKPVRIKFLPGLHEFKSTKAYRRPWFVSNTADHTFRPKPCAILVEDSQYVLVQGAGVKGKDRTTIMMSGPARMVKVINHQAENITYQGLVFDLKRPAVSEILVLETEANSAVVQVAQGSTYEITGGKFAWTGDLGDGWVMSQESDLETRKAWRKDRWSPFVGATATDLGDGKVRLAYANGNAGLVKGRAYGFRNILHDSLSFHNARSKDIVFRDCEVNAMTNMSFVSQFSENLTFQRVNVIPPPGNTFRFTPTDMDVFHFANCRGRALMDSCILSGAGDDGVNYHGIHLGIAGKPADNQLQVRFLQGQTYGFAPYAPGDEIAVINHNTLREHANNPRRKVTAVELMPGDASRKNWLITLDGPSPTFQPGDVVDNLSWQADVTVRDCKIELASCRGILATSRGKIVIEGNTINSYGPGVLIEDDANFWWESSCVRDMTIRNNTFLHCGVQIHPVAPKPDGPVHENIRIEGNTFIGKALPMHGGQWFIYAHDVKGLAITDNRFEGEKPSWMHIERCEMLKEAGNEAKAAKSN